MRLRLWLWFWFRFRFGATFVNIRVFGINNFIRRTPEVDREQLLAQKDDFGSDGLRSMGLRVVQDDKPFVDIKREDKDAATTAAGGSAA